MISLMITIAANTCNPIECPSDTWEQKFALLDTFQMSLNEFIDDSIRTTHNLVMISSPEGKHVGGWYPKEHLLAAISAEDIERLGLNIIEITIGKPAPIIIDAGSPTDDWFIGGGSVYKPEMVELEEIYRTERWGVFDYHIPSGNGTFSIDLLFAEIVRPDSGMRIMSVDLEGINIIKDLDIVDSVGFGTPLIINFQVTVLDDSLDLNFTAIKEYAKLSGIIIK